MMTVQCIVNLSCNITDHWKTSDSMHLSKHTHTQPFYGRLGFCPVLPGWSGSRKVKPESKTNLDLLEQEIVSGSGIGWAICKSAPWPRHITTPASHHSFLQAGCTSCRPTSSVIVELESCCFCCFLQSALQHLSVTLANHLISLEKKLHQSKETSFNLVKSDTVDGMMFIGRLMNAVCYIP